MLQSSYLHWRPFTLIGYSLGGALGADFTSYFPSLVSNLVLIAPSGLIRTKHISWKSRLIYGSQGLIPERIIEWIVGRRLWTGPQAARSIEPDPDLKDVGKEATGGLSAKEMYKSAHHLLIPQYPQSTVSGVVDWQIKYHKAFIPAFISSIRHGPIHNQQSRWGKIGLDINRRIRNREGGMKEVHLILGAKDPIIIAEELIEDALEVIGEEHVKWKLFGDAGHDVPMERARDIAQYVSHILDGEMVNSMILLRRRKRHVL